MNLKLTLNQQESTTEETQRERISYLDGSFVFGSNHCPKHGVSMVCAVKDPAKVDYMCVLEALEDFKHSVVQAAMEAGVIKPIRLEDLLEHLVPSSEVKPKGTKDN